MSTYDFVHLTFLAVGGAIQGKTKLQKIVYFMGLRTGRAEDLGYRPHYYGPYSDEVASAVERLKSLGFLDQSTAGLGSVDSSGFEVMRFDYRLNDCGVQMARTKARYLGEEWKRMQSAANELERLFAKSYIDLSIAAKTWFMLGQRRGHASQADLAALAPKFGWSVSADQIKAAASLLADVGLVKLG